MDGLVILRFEGKDSFSVILAIYGTIVFRIATLRGHDCQHDFVALQITAAFRIQHPFAISIAG
jgi:hypothetical protein